MARKKKPLTQVESIRHKDKRANIPTEELRDFVADEEHSPKTMLYPRDPSLDPQLVWKGKDEQDREDLAVHVVPIYIQEKIHPQAIIDALPRLEQPGDNQINLFADFNGLPEDFSDRVDFYKHEGHWSNRMILGDSLLVMASLAEKEGLKGKVQTIYLDPPYGIKFGSNWQVSTRKRDVKDGKAEDATRQPEQVRAFRDTWTLGIHSYLAYLRDRLSVARDLLTETGSVFVQIGDENVHLVRCVMDEVFGSENFQAQISFKSTNPLGAKGLPKAYDYIIWYAKDVSQVKFRPLFMHRDISDDTEYRFLDAPEAETGYRKLDQEEFVSLQTKNGIFRRSKLTSSGFTPSCTFEFSLRGMNCKPFGGKSWATNREGIQRIIWADRLFLLGNAPYFKRYFTDAPVIQFNNCWTDQPAAVEQLYVVQTAPKFIDRCLLMTTDPGDLVLDPTCGSGTTAYVAEQWGRRWITCDTSRVALALARTRLMTAKYPYYLLADSPEGIKKEMELTGKIPLAPFSKGEADVKKGFVYKRVPHVTLKSIANNPDIKEGMTRQQIDAAIAKHADTETLFDQPYEDNKRVRVCGPFSVESLSPHRTVDSGQCSASKTGQPATNHYSDFVTTILDNLKKAGVQNTRKGERLTFNRLDPYAGAWLHAVGEYTETSPSPQPSPTGGEGMRKRVAVSIGPEHGTVGPQQVKEAAKEAVQGVGFDMLIVCGFAFDPHVAEEVKRYGKLTVLPAKMNPDLAMGDELLKKTGAGNLFMVFGEPDMEVVSDQWIVDRNGRRVMSHEQFKIISGVDSLAEISGLGREDIPGNAELSKGGNLRTGQSNAKGGSLDSLEHRRRAIEEFHRRISAVSGYQQGKSGRTGDANRSGRKTEVSDASATGESSAGVHGNWQDAERLTAITTLKNLTPDHLPLTTDHFITVEIKGVDVYDPTTGQIRSASTDDIACWFIDTDYNGESFFVRHAYFTGAEEPYDKLKRALRAEVDEAAWSSLYSTVSRPFAKPESGKIAVKVINHYGDEVLKVYEIGGTKKGKKIE